jgi:beta-lactamase class A
MTTQNFTSKTLTRRAAFLLAAGASLWACTPKGHSTPAPVAAPAPGAPEGPTWEALPALSALEARAGGRLGVAILDPQTGRRAGHRAGERFALCSTFKLALAGLVLREADQGRIDLKETLSFTADFVAPLGYAPATRAAAKKAGSGPAVMSIEALAQAAQEESDNGASNLLLEKLGGVARFTALLRGIGDDTTRLDQLEPEMNLVAPGEEQNTTTPGAYAQTALTFAVGEVLQPESRAKLVGWMRNTRTGPKRLRAGLPVAWAMGHKTGTGGEPGMASKYNDVAVAFPPGRAAIAISAYYEAPGYFEEMRDVDEAVLAEAARIAAAWVMARAG